MNESEATLGGLPIAAGDVLMKKYRVERLIGEGGTGVVLSATHVQLERRVAIKFLRRALDNDELRTRFDREARAMGKIESEHVVVVLDTGALDDGAPYLVMEHLEGRDLARVLKEDGPLPVQRAVDCMLQVCEALVKAHAAGIVHRDLKPANLFLVARSDDDRRDASVHVKVLDFGISKIVTKDTVDGDSKPEEVTTAFTMLGSPRYTAPEQVRNSKDVDGRADLWSLGAVLFQLISGQHAFPAEGNVQASLAVLTGEPQSLRALVPHVPPGLEAVVMRCLTRELSLRFQSAAELAVALRPFASDGTKDSLDRIESAVDLGSFGAVAIAASSTRLPDPAILTSGKRDAPTERRIRVSGSPRAIVIDPADVPVIRASVAPTPTPHLTFTSLLVMGVVALAVLVAGVVAMRIAAGATAPAIKAQGPNTARFEPLGTTAVVDARTGEARGTPTPDAGEAASFRP